ncbi:MAG: endonuclease/exonuclease/phosphatase family protein, partial [Hyphomicrobium sp.]
FNEQVLAAKFGWSYPHFMVLDGNDDRGIDVGVASMFQIETVRSHVDDGRDTGGATFSRDCPEYDLVLPGGLRIVVIPNHFKSKRNGDDQVSRERRAKQAKRANAIARDALVRTDLVLVAGDFNDTPTSQPITHIFEGGFTDVRDHPDYPTDRPGTFGTGLAGNKIDYLVMSPALRQRLVTTGIERRGSYHPNTWQPFDTVTGASTEASDHHLVWAKFEI